MHIFTNRAKSITIYLTFTTFSASHHHPIAHIFRGAVERWNNELGVFCATTKTFFFCCMVHQVQQRLREKLGPCIESINQNRLSESLVYERLVWVWLEELRENINWRHISINREPSIHCLHISCLAVDALLAIVQHALSGHFLLCSLLIFALFLVLLCFVWFAYNAKLMRLFSVHKTRHRLCLCLRGICVGCSDWV